MLYSQICHFLGRTDIEYRKKHINIKLWCIKCLFVDKKGINCFQCVKKPVKNITDFKKCIFDTKMKLNKN